MKHLFLFRYFVLGLLLLGFLAGPLDVLGRNEIGHGKSTSDSGKS
jgi:hypothetical protein